MTTASNICGKKEERRKEGEEVEEKEDVCSVSLMKAYGARVCDLRGSLTFYASQWKELQYHFGEMFDDCSPSGCAKPDI